MACAPRRGDEGLFTLVGKGSIVSVVVSTRGLKKRPVAPATIRVRAQRMLAALDMRTVELSIMLCDDTTIRALNRTYRDRDQPTDVLSFSMREGEYGDLHPELLGDIVVSLETARSQARRAGRTVIAEVTYLVAHGLLHLLGYDHATEAQDRRMRARADALCAAATVSG